MGWGGGVGGREAVEVRWSRESSGKRVWAGVDGRWRGRAALARSAGAGRWSFWSSRVPFTFSAKLGQGFACRACEGRDWPPAPLSLPVVPAVSQHSSRYTLTYIVTQYYIVVYSPTETIIMYLQYSRNGSGGDDAGMTVL